LQSEKLRSYPSEQLCLASVLDGLGHHPHQQILRGLRRESAIRGLRGHRSDRDLGGISRALPLARSTRNVSQYYTARRRILRSISDLSRRRVVEMGPLAARARSHDAGGGTFSEPESCAAIRSIWRDKATAAWIGGGSAPRLQKGQPKLIWCGGTEVRV